MEHIQVLRRWPTRAGWVVAALSFAVVLAALLIGRSPASAQAGATEVDLALIVTKRGLQEHVVDISVNPPKTHLQILVKNQGTTSVTAISVAHRIPAGMQFSILSSPLLPNKTIKGAPVTVSRDAAGRYLIDQLAPGDSVAVDLTLDIIDKSPGRFVNAAEIISMAGPDGEAAVDQDSTADDVTGNDEIEDTPGIDAADPQNSHNDIDYDQGADGQSFPTPNDEDDHDTEVVVIPPVVNIGLFLDPDTSTPLAAGQPVTFLVDILSLGAPVQTLDIAHQIDARVWQPFALADNAISSAGGREIIWNFEAGGVTATVVGSMPAGERDLVPITLTPAVSFAGDASTLAHSVTVASVNDAAPYEASYYGAVEGGIIAANATAEMLDLALRLRVDEPASDLPPTPGSRIVLQIDVANQGSVPVDGFQIFQHIDHESWQRFAVADNPPATTTGDAVLDVSWESDEFGARATLDGQLRPGESVRLAVALRVSDAFTNPNGYLSTEAEISAVQARNAAGQPLVDVDSEPDEFNYDATVDDVTDNSGGDEDDHDTAFINQRFAVGNQAWVDADGDGVSSDDEDALVGLELELFYLANDLGVDVTTANPDPIATTATDDAGFFLFDGIAPGTYVIKVAESAREAGGAAFGMSPAIRIGDEVTADGVPVDGDNDAFTDADGQIVAGPFVLGEGLPQGEIPRAESSTIDALDDLTIDFGLVAPQVAEGSQNPDGTNPPQLAFTGAAHRALIMLGMFLIVTGSAAVRLSGRR